ncbi:MAG: M48 family peptidase [Verrucomicrobiaceae bacterium]|nr:MAG: M48 family peptidase [Verrucomicrobiaceae bacterium]
MQSFQQVLQDSDVISSGPEYEMVQRVASRIARATGPASKDFQWSVALVRSPQVNAFCLPGGKIVIFTGILPIAQDETGLATVMGHEVAHATARHGAERVFKQRATQTILTGAQFSMADMDWQQRQAVMGALGAGAQYGILMPFGRDHEVEADKIGLNYMAAAGYDPRASVAFWERMAQASKNSPPEFVSTHPSHGTRVERLKQAMPEALKIYESNKGANQQTQALPAARDTQRRPAAKRSGETVGDLIER